MAIQNTADLKVQLVDQMEESWSECSRNDDQKTFKENLQEMMSMMLNCPLYGRGGDGSIYITVDNYIIDTIYANPSPSDIVDICRSVFLKQYIDIIEVIKLCYVDLHFYERSKRNSRVDQACFVLLWLVELIQLRDPELFETVLKMFCEDLDLGYKLSFSVSWRLPTKEGMLDILDVFIDRFIKAVANAEIILPASYRVSLLTDWISTLSKLISYTSSRNRFHTGNRFEGSLEEGIIAIAETLSFSEQKDIYNIWKFHDRPTGIAIEWWSKKVSDAHRALTSSNDPALRDIKA